MNEEQVERLLNEFAETRASFESANEAFSGAIRSIKWNKINTVILYSLMVVVFFFGALGVVNFLNYQKEACERGNETRLIVIDGMRANGFAIGSALAVVFNAEQEDLDRYLEAYNTQKVENTIPLREC